MLHIHGWERNPRKILASATMTTKRRGNPTCSLFVLVLLLNIVCQGREANVRKLILRRKKARILPSPQGPKLLLG